MFFKSDKRISTIGLTFKDTALEQQFQRYAYPYDMSSFKLGMLLGLNMYVGFILIDSYIHWSILSLMIAIRLMVSLCLGGILLLACQKKQSPKKLQWLSISAVVMAQIGHFLMGIQADIHPFYLLLTTSLLMFFMYTVIPLFFRYALWAGGLTWLLFQFFPLYIHPVPDIVYIYQSTILTCTLLLGILAGYIIEKNQRWSFLKTLTIKKQNEQLVRNSTNQERLLRDLHLKNQELEQFAYAISHDLKSPLRVIAGLATIIERTDGDRLSKYSKADFEMIKDQVGQMSTMIQGVLAYSKVGRGELPIEEVNISAIIRDIQKTFSTEQKVDWVIAQGMPSIFACRAMVVQLFQNLISNAVKYNDKEICTIKINYQTTPQYVQFSITDNGPGIEKEYANKIFKLFNTLQVKQKDSTGIGLAIVKKIIDRVKGKIYLDTTQLIGAKFVFQIPKDWNDL